MHLERIVTLANAAVSLRLKVLERSLRATGCDLPLFVIPYDNETFELPENAQWWEEKELIEWLRSFNAHPMMRKYQCLTIGNYQFVDSDVLFLRNPEKELQDNSGFVTCCGHWRNTDHAVDDRVRKVLSRRSTNWQRYVFNAGQFACDRALYDFESLKKTAERNENKATALMFPHHDQPGLNLLVALANPPYRNLTLPPEPMESSWAGDYVEREQLWSNDNAPYLLHWAGTPMVGDNPVNALLRQYLSSTEFEEWERIETERADRTRAKRSLMQRIRNKLGTGKSG